MKKISTLLVISTILIACNNNNNNCFMAISPKLDSILDEYIDKNPNNKIYYLIFENRCNKQFFTLQCSSDCYDSHFVDGCFMKKGKIIIFGENRDGSGEHFYKTKQKSSSRGLR